MNRRLSDLRPLLVVDDDQMNLALTKVLLKRAGIPNPVLTAMSGEEAQSVLRKRCRCSGARRVEKPIVVLLDINLPGISGFGVLKWLRTKPAFRDVKVVIWTTSNDEEDQRRARELNADAYLIKFAKAPALGAVLRKLVGDPSAI
jgi:two-component system, response regulator